MRLPIIASAKTVANVYRVRRWCLLVLFAFVGSFGVLAQSELGLVWEVHSLYPREWGAPHPVGVAYAGATGHLFLLDQENAAPARTTADLVIITPYEDLVGSVQLPFTVDDAINLAIDDAGGQLLLFNNQQAALAKVAVGADGLPVPETLVRVDLAHLGPIQAEGMAVDLASRRLWFLDSGAARLVGVDLDGDFANSTQIDLAVLGVTSLRGLAIHPLSHHFFVMDPSAGRLYELTQTGQPMIISDLAPLALVDAGGLAFGFSSDLTDLAETIHLFAVDSNQPDQPPAAIPGFGRILELDRGVAGANGRLQRLVVPITVGTDDVEERVATRATNVNSSDLELSQDTNGDQIVGIRFANLDLPAGATIISAYIEFTADRKDSAPTELVIHGEASDDATPLTDANGDLSRRPLTTAGVAWSAIPAWQVLHERHQTPNLAPIMQEIVERSGWQGGKAIAFFITGKGRRTATAYDGDPALAPRLVVDYSRFAPPPIPTPTSTPVAPISPTPPNTTTLRLAVIGDFGRNNDNERQVADLVAGWDPDLVITTGDNNYPDGAAATIDETIGQYYSQFIGDYQGSYGLGSVANRFWPSLGNHDWHTITCSGANCTGAYFDYFTLPNNERYYDVDLGLVHLFVLDSDGGEPDGRAPDSLQANWLRNRLASSTACYDLVSFHHPPYSSGRHGSHPTMQWPFGAWGADAVLSGHDHLYERLDVGGIPYFVNGAGGASLYNFEHLGTLPPEVISAFRYNQTHGAMLIFATATEITYQFYAVDGTLIDAQEVAKDCAGASPTFGQAPTLTPTATVKSLVTPTLAGLRPNPTTATSPPEGTPSVAPTTEGAKVIPVPGDTPTFQAAVDLAHDVDAGLVAPDSYQEKVYLPVITK